jgi:threonine dehydrogenase-like Zn-dependent dehydrogenase
VKALTFDYSIVRCGLARILGMIHKPLHLSTFGPVRYRDVPEPKLVNDDWVILQTQYTGICGSDLRQVFLDGTSDNPLTALISFPHVMGHEVAGVIAETGRAVTSLQTGDRVIVYPWLTCDARSLPRCPACQMEHCQCCQNTTEGALGVGMHLGVNTQVVSGFAPLFAVHKSMCFRIPKDVRSDHAALADPFAVSWRAVSKAQPQAGQTILVIGCGSLGMWVVKILRTYHPDVRTLAVDTHEHVRERVCNFGADAYYTLRGAALIEAIAHDTKAVIRQPRAAPPWLLGSGPGVGVDTIIDTVGTSATVDAGLRIVKPMGRIVHVGLARRANVEWTPLYFKEITMVGSNGCGMETIAGQPQHTFAYYLDQLDQGCLDANDMITHEFPLPEYRRAFITAKDKGRFQSLKVMFNFCNGNQEPGRSAMEAGRQAV